MSMHNYRIYKDKWEHFLLICDRDNLSYEVVPDKIEGQNFTGIKMDIPRGRFNELLEDIECEVQRAKCLAKAPVISARTYFNPKKLNRLLDWYGYRSFRILKRDEDRILGL